MCRITLTTRTLAQALVQSGGVGTPLGSDVIRRYALQVILMMLLVGLVSAGCRTDAPDVVVPEPPVIRGDRTPGILVGTNYTHQSFSGCGFEGTPLLLRYHSSEVRSAALEHLVLMRRRGVESLRLILWHMDDVGGHTWGVVASPGGKLSAQISRNLRQLIEDINAMGYLRFTVAFGPQWTNNPRHPDHTPAHARGNLRLIESVMTIAEASELPIRFDLLNEGAPARSFDRRTYRRVASYIADVWEFAARRMDPSRFTVSVIAPRSEPETGQRRLASLLEILDQRDFPAATWVEIHVHGSASEVEFALTHVDEVLDARGVPTEVTLGETVYNDRAVAAVLVEMQTEMALSEVLQWFSRPPRHCNVDPPYQIDAYVDAFRSSRTVPAPPEEPQGR